MVRFRPPAPCFSILRTVDFGVQDVDLVDFSDLDTVWGTGWNPSTDSFQLFSADWPDFTNLTFDARQVIQTLGPGGVGWRDRNLIGSTGQVVVERVAPGGSITLLFSEAATSFILPAYTLAFHPGDGNVYARRAPGNGLYRFAPASSGRTTISDSHGLTFHRVVPADGAVWWVGPETLARWDLDTESLTIDGSMPWGSSNVDVFVSGDRLLVLNLSDGRSWEVDAAFTPVETACVLPPFFFGSAVRPDFDYTVFLQPDGVLWRWPGVTGTG